MVRGTVIFGSGIVVGYSLAMRAQEPNGEVKAATADFLRTMKAIMVDAWLDTKLDMKEAKAKDEKEEGKDG